MKARTEAQYESTALTLDKLGLSPKEVELVSDTLKRAILEGYDVEVAGVGRFVNLVNKADNGNSELKRHIVFLVSDDLQDLLDIYDPGVVYGQSR